MKTEKTKKASGFSRIALLIGFAVWNIVGIAFVADTWAIGPDDHGVMIPLHEKVDWTDYPRSLGVLGNRLLMHPIDVGDWPLKIDSKHQLFVDDYLMAEFNNVEREFHRAKRYAGNPVIRPDKPWERTGNEGWGVNGCWVLRDATTGKFRMWYDIAPFPDSFRDKKTNRHFRRPLCYAESDDGIHWTKPPAGIYDFKEYPNNNIIHWISPLSLFFDPKEKDPNKKYKAFMGEKPPNVEVEGRYLFSSPDGIRWKEESKRWIIPIREASRRTSFKCAYRPRENGLPDNGACNVTPYYDSLLGKYVADVKYRIPRPKIQCVMRSESDDLIHWTQPVMTLFPDHLDREDNEIYYMYSFSYESMWLGMIRVKRTKDTGWKQVDVQLVTSRDRQVWSRAGNREVFIPLGEPDSWEPDYTRPISMPILVGDEIWIYYTGSRNMSRDNVDNFQFQIGLATLRRDGFVSLNAGEKPGTVITRPLAYDGRRLFVNADVAPGGYVKAALLDVDGKPIDAYRLAECIPVEKDAVRSGVAWQKQETMSADTNSAPEKHVRLVFEIENAKLYSFWIE